MVSRSDYAICSSFLSSKISDILLNLFDVKGSKFVILVRFLRLEFVVDSLLDSEVVVVNTSISFVALLQSFKEIFIVFSFGLDGLGFSEFVFPLFSDAFLFFAGFGVGSLQFRNFTSILLLE